jgi:hypothetical protein
MLNQNVRNADFRFSGNGLSAEGESMREEKAIRLETGEQTQHII